MTEAELGQTIDSSPATTSQNDVPQNTNEATISSGDKSTDSQEIINQTSAADKETAQKRYKESNEKRKIELSELRKKLAEQEEKLARAEADKQRYHQIASNPPQEGQVFDDFLGGYIPDDLPPVEYRKLILAKQEENQKEHNAQEAVREYKRQEEEFYGGVQENIEAALVKNPNIENILRNAANSGLIDVTFFKALADKRAGWNEDGLLFLAGLCESNQQALRDIMTKCPTDEAKAAAIGKLSAKYFDKPELRVTKLSDPISPISEKGNKNLNKVSMQDTFDGFSQRRELRLQRLMKGKRS